jgi:FeS assembly SUF system protein
MTNERDMIDLSAPSTPASDEKAAVGEIIEAPTEEVAQVSAIPPQELARLSDDIVTAIKTVYDPEIPVDMYELGLIYKIDVSDERNIAIEMTLTAPGCPVAGEMPVWVENAVNTVEGVGMVDVHLVFDPPWDPSRMTDEARVALDMF